MLADVHTSGITSRFNAMNNKMLEYTRRLVVLMAVACLAAALSVSVAVAQKPDFAGTAAEKGGRSDEAKEHAKERGKGGKRGLDKETERKDKDSNADDKKAKKDKKDKKARKDRRARRGLDKETEGKDKDHGADDKKAKKDKEANKGKRARRIKNRKNR